MKVLLITDEEWNDVVYANNILTNWFYGFDAEFAQIYCSPGLPYNNICQHYFQITDMQMVLSLFLKGGRAGAMVQNPDTIQSIEASKKNVQRQGYYLWFKKLSLYIHTPMMVVRDAIWTWGRYDKTALETFVRDFNPDIVFCPRLVTPKMMRLEKIVSAMTNAPFIAFTADNESSLNCYSWSPLFWMRRIAINRAFKKHVQLYSHYFMFSEEQASDYKREYNVPTSCLYKCGDFNLDLAPKIISRPIRMIYAGRLYCNRWKTLAAVGEALQTINKEKERIYLDIYTVEKLSKEQERVLSKDKFVYVHSAISSDRLALEYKNADIALHVESFDKANRMATHYSFSTKIIDLMASTCAIMAICWECHAGYQYLKKHDAAFCISSYDDILPVLKTICEHPSLIGEYARKAWYCGTENHTREKVHGQIKKTFENVIRQKTNA